MGETTKTASVVPAARPATIGINQRITRHIQANQDLPKKTERVLTLPSASAIHSLYNSNEEKRIAILGTIPETTAPRPLYKAQKDSFLMIFPPTPKKPRGLPYIIVLALRNNTNLILGTFAFLAAFLANCILTLMVSRG